MSNNSWFKEAKFGMMIHFGLYSLLGGEWKGQRMNQIGEWAQSYFRIPNEEYHQLAKAFNPVCFNADEWIKCAKDAGMKYFVITSKHHDGFALFRSKASKFNVVDATPFGRDIIAELAESCYKHGMKFGLYYSQNLDWEHPDGGGFKYLPDNLGMSWGNDWSFTEADRTDYRKCYEEKIKPQIKEILTGYGDLCLIWFDTPMGQPKEYSIDIYNMVKEYQPNCMVNSRLGGGYFDYSSAGDNYIPDDDKGEHLVETPATLNDTWGWKSFDQNWKSADEILRIKEHLNSRGMNYLLNVGPDNLGRFPAESVRILGEVGKKLRSMNK